MRYYEEAWVKDAKEGRVCLTGSVISKGDKFFLLDDGTGIVKIEWAGDPPELGEVVRVLGFGRRGREYIVRAKYLIRMQELDLVLFRKIRELEG